MELTKEEAEELARISNSGFIKLAGIEITDIGEGYCEGRIEVREEHLNPNGALHGGLLFALADTVGGASLRKYGIVPTTSSSTINYLRPTVGAKIIRARAETIKKGKNNSVVRIELYTDKDVHVTSVIANYADLSDRIGITK